MSEIHLTNHFIERYRERIAKTTPQRISEFANNAYKYGKDSSEIKSSQFRKLMTDKNKASNVVAKIYKGFIYIFSKDNTAITVYRIPKQLNGFSIYI